MDERREVTGGRDDRQTIDEREHDLPTFEDGSRPGDAESGALTGHRISLDERTVYDDPARGDKRGYGESGAARSEPFPAPYASGVRKSDEGPGSGIRDSNLSGGAEESDKV